MRSYKSVKFNEAIKGQQKEPVPIFDTPRSWESSAGEGEEIKAPKIYKKNLQIQEAQPIIIIHDKGHE
mgnify:CR=1 FL=1